MPPSSPTNSRKLVNSNSNNTNSNQSRNQLVERCSSLRGCEPCKRRKRICNGQRPCTHCVDASQDCVYSVVSDHPRSVFTTSTARRLSSGSACETCRRRKTKCDGCSPCSFCASSGIECVNNSERRKRSNATSQLNNSNGNSSSQSSNGDNEAIDRIEDRLRRIEKLMTAFSPSPLAQSTLFAETRELKRVAAGYRKMSSPHPSPAIPSVRQHRYSVPGISVARGGDEKYQYQEELQKSALDSQKVVDLDRNESTLSSTSSTTGSLNSFHHLPHQQQDSFSNHSTSPPLSPSPPPLSNNNMSPPSSTGSRNSLKQSLSHHTNNSISMFNNLSLSPSTSSTSSASNSSILPPPPHMQPSVSTPTSPLNITTTTNGNRWLSSSLSLSNRNQDNASLSTISNHSNEWRQTAPFPSLMDQLSKCTFAAYSTVHYPIYPLSPASSKGDTS